LWSFLYGAVQGWFALGHEPEWPWGVGLFVPAWAAAGLCAVAFALVAALISRPRWSVVVGAWAVAATLAVSSCLLLLDLVGTVLPGMGLTVQPSAVVNRSAGWPPPYWSGRRRWPRSGGSGRPARRAGGPIGGCGRKVRRRGRGPVRTPR